MKNFKSALLPIILVFVLPSCKKETFGIIKGQGVSVTETRKISGFNKIEQSMDAELFYVQDSVFMVSINAQQNIQKIIQTETEGGTLKIFTRKTLLKHNPIKIYVHSPEMYGLTLNGGGTIKAEQSINTSTLELRLSGSGNIVLNQVNAQSTDARISGSGDLNINGGTITSEDLHISGSGNIDFLNVKADNCSTQTSGSGNVSVQVMQQLNVKISGSGDVKYKGNPGVDANISGSGKLIHLN